MMALSLRYVKPNLLKIVTRHCRLYSTQIDGLRLDESAHGLIPREELNHYQELVTDKVSAILEEGKRLATSVCAISNSTSVNHDVREEVDFASLISKASELQAQIAANAIVPYFHFYDSFSSQKEEATNESTVSLQHKHLIQSYSYVGDSCPCNSVDLDNLLTNGEALDYTFGVDTAQTLPPHLLAYVRENAPSSIQEYPVYTNINPKELLQLELEECQTQFFKHEQVVHCSNKSSDVKETENSSSNQPSSQRNDKDNGRKPSRDQLFKVHELMTKELPKVLLSRHDYRQYRPDIIFENNFFAKSYITKGIAQYVVEVAKLRMWAHFKYANVKMALLKSTIEEDEGTVTFHWRMSGVPQIRAFMFWKFLPWTYRDNVRKESDFHEGISTFYVDNTGLIAKHQLDKTMLDKEFEPVEPRKNLREKLSKLLSPKPAIGAACKSGNR